MITENAFFQMALLFPGTEQVHFHGLDLKQRAVSRRRKASVDNYLLKFSREGRDILDKKTLKVSNKLITLS